MTALRVEASGRLTTVQDLGRLGFERFGVPASGAMDPVALRAANALVGNPAGAAGLELGWDGLTVTAGGESLWAVTGAGAGLSARVNGRARPLWTALYVRAGETLEIEKAPGGWAYVGVRGGVEVPLVMGARATYVRGGFGGWQGRPLRAGDELPIGPLPAAGPLPALAGRRWPPEARPVYGPAVTVGVVRGPQAERFSAEMLAAFFSAEYTVTPDADRMGYRLSGPTLIPAEPDLLSEAMPLGAIQVPAGGAPIVMLADRPTTGGYPKIAVVARADIPLVAQCPPGGRLRFQEITVAEAQARYRAQLMALSHLEPPGVVDF